MNKLKLWQKIFFPISSYLLMFTHLIIRRVLSHLLRWNIIDKQQTIYQWTFVRFLISVKYISISLEATLSLKFSLSMFTVIQRG